MTSADRKKPQGVDIATDLLNDPGWRTQEELDRPARKPMTNEERAAWDYATGKTEAPPCPKCQSANVVPIMYGEPASEAREAAERGEIVLGGCCIEAGVSPEWHCKDCGNEFGIYDPKADEDDE